MKLHGVLWALCVGAAAAAASGGAAPAGPAGRPPRTIAEAVERTMRPYDGPSNPGVDTATLTGKVMCGYQGWFTCPGDGAGRGWYHWGKGRRFAPGACTIDLWPDVSELDADERFATDFRHADGRAAEVYSPMIRKTVVRHFRWMKEHGIDGVFVQRFAGEIRSPAGLNHFTTVLGHCRAGANLHGRAWAVMYDLSGLPAGGTRGVLEDWRRLVAHMKVGRDPKDKAYLRHEGRPVVAVWGVGFSDRRKYTVAECGELVRRLKTDPGCGPCTVMLGVPTFWRTLRRDAVNAPKLHEVIAAADIVSPWMVGRFSRPEQAAGFARDVWKSDIDWCRARKIDYLPVVFPGFSWHNMRPASRLGLIPRRGGRFLWRQFLEARKVGATMVYGAMFDEVDEGTALFKCTNTPPVGASEFLTYEGLPSDHYLWLTGQGGRLIRGEIPATDALPKRRNRPGR